MIETLLGVALFGAGSSVVNNARARRQQSLRDAEERLRERAERRRCMHELDALIVCAVSEISMAELAGDG